MVFEAGFVDIGIALLLAVALAKYGKFMDKAEKGFNWIAASGVLLIFAGIVPLIASLSWLTAIPMGWLANLSGLIGGLFALVGTIFVGYESVLEK